jgi:excisionase family DNA binding protein
MDTLLLKPDEAAAELRLSRATVYQLLASGRLRSVAVGRARRIPREALREFVEQLVGEGSAGVATRSGSSPSED